MDAVNIVVVRKASIALLSVMVLAGCGVIDAMMNEPEEDAGFTDDVGLSDAGDPDAGEPDAGGPEANSCGGQEELLWEGETVELGDDCGPCKDGAIVCDGIDDVRCIHSTAANECGGCEPLPGRVGDACGPCDSGSYECDGAGGMECVGADEFNECGGCGELDALPGSSCESQGVDGSYECTGPDDVRCVIPGENACGGEGELGQEPGTPCGSCDGGTWTCDETELNEVFCKNENAGVNVCGGCEPLFGVLGDECGVCEGEWACDGENDVFCDEPPLNACGGCEDLGTAMPGQLCDDAAIYICETPEALTCTEFDEIEGSTNACGGSEELSADPGDSCGPCGDGVYICASWEETVCSGAGEFNDCGGCEELAGEPGTVCGEAKVWVCDDDDTVNCEPEGGEEARGGLKIDIAGLPDGVEPQAEIYDSDEELVTTVDGPMEVEELPPGDYEILVSDVVDAHSTYVPTQYIIEVTVVADEMTDVVLVYELVYGELELRINGLPAGVDADVSLLGPDGFEDTVTESMDYDDLVPGVYHVMASDVSSGGVMFEAQPQESTIDVISYGYESVTVEYLCVDERDATQICDDEAGECGVVADACGDQVDCGGCSGCSTCDANQCVDDDSKCTGDYGVCHNSSCYECTSDSDCDTGDSCSTSQCSNNQCVTDDICAGTATECGCTSCTDCTLNTGAYEVGAAYACCDGEEACLCQDYEFRDYYCDGTSCSYTVVDTWTEYTDCTECGDNEECVDGQCASVEASAQHSSITGEEGAVADGIDEALIIIELLDDNQNPIVGVTPEFSATGTGNDGEQCGETNGEGIAECTMTSTVAEEKALAIVEPVVVDDGETVEFVECDAGGEPFGGGTGDSANPYRLCSAAQLSSIGEGTQYLADAFVMKEDIDMEGVADYDVIGDNSNPFVGEFDGGGHRIENLTIDEPSQNRRGIFGVTGPTASIQALVLDEVTVYGNFRVGLLVGLHEGEIADVEVAGNVEASSSQVGGIVGRNDGIITDCHFDGSVDGEGHSAGGVAGASSGTITDCEATGSVFAQGGEIGGLVGTNAGGEISGCATWSSVFGEGDEIGGLVGTNTGGEISGCATYGDVQGHRRVGGLVGQNEEESMISDSYSEAILSSYEDQHQFGGLVGVNRDGSSIVDSHTAADVLLGPEVNNVGGLVGSHISEESTIANSYALGDVSGGTSVGGLIGSATSDASDAVSDSYALGHVSGVERVGGFVGRNGSVITNSYAEGNVEGEDRVGGFAGTTFGDIADSHAIGQVQATGNNVGGFIGQSTYGSAGSWTIERCYATGNVMGSPDSEDVGGFVGQNARNSEIIDSYATGDVTGYERVGGFVGENFEAFNRRPIVRNSFATGDVSGFREVGGLVGRNGGIDSGGRIFDSFAVGEVDGYEVVGGLAGRLNGGLVRDTYFAGTVEGTEFVGGLVGLSGSTTVWSSYWDEDTTGIDENEDSSGEGEPLTTVEFEEMANFEGWDFSGIWVMGPDDDAQVRPQLRWTMECDDDSDCDAGSCTSGVCELEGTFVSVWKTDNPGVSQDDQIQLPLVEEGDYDFTVYWGDGASAEITSWDQSEATHTYSTPGTYAVEIEGELEGWRFDNGGDAEKIVEIGAWGPLRLGEADGAQGAFYGARNLEITAPDRLDVSDTVSLANAFRDCESLESIPSAKDWDMSAVEVISSMFRGATLFDDDIGEWDVANVVDMSSAFKGAEAFNQSIGEWNVGQVKDMSSMFKGASSFNSAIGGWDVGNVTDMSAMFYDADAFNEDIGDWDVSSVVNMENMFRGINFSADISEWDVGNVTNMASMFYDAAFFNRDIGQWDVSSVTDMSRMFHGANWFDQDLGGWEIGEVTDMTEMFEGIELSTSNYDALLIGWSAQSVQSGVTFGAGDSQYSEGVAEDARQELIDVHGWSIDDGGMAD